MSSVRRIAALNSYQGSIICQSISFTIKNCSSLLCVLMFAILIAKLYEAKELKQKVKALVKKFDEGNLQIKQ